MSFDGIEETCRGDPMDYAKAVEARSNDSKLDSLYPGSHYRFLASFLKSNFGRALKSVNPVTEQHNHTVAVLHDLAYARDDPRYLTCFTGPDGPKQFAQHVMPNNWCGQILFVRGLLSPCWINTIGGLLNVDPEIFRRHLQPYDRNMEAFDLPSLPSTSDNIIHLSFSTLGSNKKAPHERLTWQTDLRWESLLSNNDWRDAGKSIIRQLWSLNGKYFLIEQHILITIVRRPCGWVGE